MGKQQGGKGSGSARKKQTSRKARRPGLRFILLGAAVFLTGASLLAALSLPHRGQLERAPVSGGERAQETRKEIASRESPPEQESSTVSDKEVASRESPPEQEGSTASDAGDMEYEEQGDPFSQAVEQVDLALVQSLATSGVEPDRLRHVAIDSRRSGGREYRFQEIELRVSPRQGRRIVEELERLLGNWLPDRAELEAVSGAPGSWRIRLRDMVTHRIGLDKGVDGGKEAQEKNGPRIALVVDDMGNSLKRARALLRLFGKDIALSVLPDSPYSEEIARAARERGADVLLHLPMEPKGYPDTDPGSGALLVNMGDERIRSRVRRDLEKVPGLVGVNNHMGSRFTAAEGPMREVLQVLRGRDLFYMDSLTSPDSVGASLASDMGLPTISRDVFLDNEKKVESIRCQLRKAEHLAREHGHAVVSAHPYPQTIEALRLWLADRDDRIRLCRLSRLVRTQQNTLQAERRMEDDTTDAGDY